MAFEELTNGDQLFDLGLIENEGYCSIAGRAAYRLYVDYKDDIEYKSPDDVVVRIEITYLHLHGQRGSGLQPSGGFWNAGVLTWFAREGERHVGNGLPGVYLNLQPEDDTCEYAEDDAKRTTLNSAEFNGQPLIYNSTPIAAVAYPDSISLSPYGYGNDFTYFWFANTQENSEGKSWPNYTIQPSNIYMNNLIDFNECIGVAMWGDVFNSGLICDFNKLELNNSLADTGFHLASNRCRDKNDKHELSYDDALGWDLGNMEIIRDAPEPCLASIEMTIGQMKSAKITDEDSSPGTTTDVYDPYMLSATIPIASWWTRAWVEEGAHPHTEWFFYGSASAKLVLKYPDTPNIPEYDLPDPVKYFDDNTVFRLKKQYNADGSLVVDKNNNPILAWIKCEKIGKDA